MVIPVHAAAPTEVGTTPAVLETGKTGKFGPGEEESSPPDTVTTYRELAYKIAARHGVSGEVVSAVIECESEWNPRAVGDQGNSHGLAQIYMPVWGKQVSVQQARDPEFAINFMAEKMAQGESNLWTCYRKLY